MTTIKETLEKKKLLLDGAFGTYYAHLYDTKELPELANTKYPERVSRIHNEYIASGAQVIRTNTFACNTVALGLSLEEVQENIREGYRLAKETASAGNVYVAADIGPIAGVNPSKEYVEICRTFLEAGADVFVFETFSDVEDIREAVDLISDRAFVIVQFSVNQYGYSSSGLSARKLIRQTEKIEWVDAVGFNCGVGPSHMQQTIRNILPEGKKYLTALPNAGYPQFSGNRVIYDTKNIDYFAEKISDIAKDGADIVGGCCGTTPEYIRKIKEKMSFARSGKKSVNSNMQPVSQVNENHGFFLRKRG